MTCIKSTRSNHIHTAVIELSDDEQYASEQRRAKPIMVDQMSFTENMSDVDSYQTKHVLLLGQYIKMNGEVSEVRAASYQAHHAKFDEIPPACAAALRAGLADAAKECGCRDQQG